MTNTKRLSTPKKKTNSPKVSKLANSNKKTTSLIELPVIPLKDLVVFPRMILPVFIGRQQSVAAIENAIAGANQLVLLTQKRETESYPTIRDLPRIGVYVQVLQTLRLPDGSIKLMVECKNRLKVTRFPHSEPFIMARIRVLDEAQLELTEEQNVLVQLMLKQFNQFIQMSQYTFAEAMEHMPQIEEPGILADMIAAYIPATVQEKQKILEILDPIKRLEAVGRMLSKAIELVSLENQIHNKIKYTIDKSQKEYFLREKLRSIREELGEEEDPDILEYYKKAETLPSKEVKDKAIKEIQRLEKMPVISAESAVIRNYLELLLELPWQSEMPVEISLKQSEEILKKDHYGLHKVKDRILEYLAVRKMATKPQNTLLCLVGPPGVGKTSFGRSIAHATGRQFERIALGGVGDDSEIRGHRRTYVGALPGRIIQALRRAGTSHLVILLDEVDKLTKSFHGDPASALLEVLDPEQNNTFRDHFLELPFDLSNVLFICAGNVVHSMPKPLRDRMEVIQLSGYTEEEKIQIARGYLIPRQLEKTGLTGLHITLTTRAICHLIQRYTREAGVRELERKIGAIFRKLARLHLQKDKYPKRIASAQQVEELLGSPPYHPSFMAQESEVGLVRGLAWTEIGGSVLPIEVALSPGKGDLKVTGNLGDIMKESVDIALGFVRTGSHALHIEDHLLKKKDVHLHVPEGAIPKDGPSAGIAITTALVSAFRNQPVPAKVAMTGEVTLRGKVLPIGGLKEKSLAAYREGIKKILIPFDNQSDLEDIPQEVRDSIRFIPVKDMKAVLKESNIT